MSFSSSSPIGANSPSSHFPEPKASVYRRDGLRQVGERLSAEVHALTDDERERHIHSCAVLMEQAMQRWHDHGDFADRGEADRWRLLMQEAIKGRSAAQVARMERERGLA